MAKLNAIEALASQAPPLGAPLEEGLTTESSRSSLIKINCQTD